jgi:CHASE3 domain sensor protein
MAGNLIQENDRQTTAVAARSSALRVQLQKMTFGILSANASAGDFLLSGNERALIPFRKANDAAPGIIGAIEQLCDGNTEELDRIHKIATLSDTAFDKLSDLRQYAPNAKPPSRPPDAALAAARKSVQALVKAVAAFQDSESRGLAQSLKSIGHNTIAGQQTLTDFGGALAIGAGMFSSVILAAVILRRERQLLELSVPVEEAAAVVPALITSLTPDRNPMPVDLLPPIENAPSVREVVEFAVTDVSDLATARTITFRAEIGPIWEFAVGASPASLQQVIVGVLAAIINSSASGGPVTISCSEQPGRFVRMQFQFYGKLVAGHLPETLLASARGLSGCSIRGADPGTIYFEFPCVPMLTDVANLQKATQSTIGIASPV